jgi:hypothetical protein
MADVYTPPAMLRVKRDGPRGWHWIAAASFDPSRHELIDEPQQAPSAPTPDKPRRGRPPKHQPTGASHGDR